MGTVKGKLPPMKKAKPATKPKSAAKVMDEAPMPKAVTSTADRKKHERTAKRSEENRIEKRDRLAASYLEQRDGMDPDTAKAVVASMDAADIEALISEANTSVLAQTGAPSAAPTSPAATPESSPVPDADNDTTPAIDFLSVPALADDDTFSEIAIRCRDNAITKNKAEKEYKADKKVLDTILQGAGIGKDQPVMCVDVRLVRYTGKSPRQLSDTKLLEKGVSIDIINQCWVQGSYDDVRVTTPKVGT